MIISFPKGLPSPFSGAVVVTLTYPYKSPEHQSDNGLVHVPCPRKNGVCIGNGSPVSAMPNFRMKGEWIFSSFSSSLLLLFLDIHTPFSYSVLLSVVFDPSLVIYVLGR